MRKTRYFRVELLAYAGLFLTAFVPTGGPNSAWGDEPVAEIRLDPVADAAELDLAKGRIEGPLKRAFALNQTADLLAELEVAKEKIRRPADRGKGLIELGAKRLVLLSVDEVSGKLASVAPRAENAGSTNLQANDPDEVASEQPFSEEHVVASDSENPRVAPGKVNWHADFTAACQASQHSGKPVFLFQLLGQLDQRFT